MCERSVGYSLLRARSPWSSSELFADVCHTSLLSIYLLFMTAEAVDCRLEQ